MRFIEYMDVGNLNGWKLDHVVPADEIVARIDAEMPLEPIESSYRGEVAMRYRYRDGGGEMGVITSVTKPFCGDCTRLRLSPEGRIYTCLFASTGVDLRGALRGRRNRPRAGVSNQRHLGCPHGPLLRGALGDDRGAAHPPQGGDVPHRRVGGIACSSWEPFRMNARGGQSSS